MLFISVLNFYMFMMTVIIYCLVISSAFLFLPQFVSSPFSGTGGNCGVLLPRQTVGGAFPCFLRCSIWFEDMLWEWFEYSVCVGGGERGVCLILSSSHFGFSTLRTSVTEPNERRDKLPWLTITVVWPLTQGPGEPTLRTERQIDSWPPAGSLVVILKC